MKRAMNRKAPAWESRVMISMMVVETTTENPARVSLLLNHLGEANDLHSATRVRLCKKCRCQRLQALKGPEGQRRPERRGYAC